jgi:PAS domain S-box-containing protein
MSTRILLADDHPVMREGLRQFLTNLSEIEVIGEAEDGASVVEKAQELAPDLIIMDVAMPGLTGIEATRKIIQMSPTVKVLGLSIHEDKRFVLEMLRAGAMGYLIKDKAAEEFKTALDFLAQDRIYISPAVMNREIEELINNRSSDPERKKKGPSPAQEAPDEPLSIQAVEIIRDNEERLKTLFEYAPDAIYLNDLKGNFVDGNRLAEELTGYKRDELIGKSFMKLRLLPPDQAVKAAALLAKNTLGQATGPDEITLRRRDGTSILVEIRSHPLRIKERKLVLGIARDISERKRAEETAHRFNRILERSLNEIYIFDAGTLKFIKVNQGARDNLGYSMAELRELTPLDLKPEFSAERFSKLVHPLRTGGKAKIQFETVHKRKDGSLYPVEVHLQLSQDGPEPVFFAIILDITKRKQAEERELQHQRDLRFLAEAAMGFMELAPEENVYRFIGKNIQEIAGGSSIVAISEFDLDSGIFKVQAIEGIGQGLKYAMKAFGGDPRSLTGNLRDPQSQMNTEGKLKRIECGIHEYSRGAVPKPVAMALEKHFGLKNIYGISFVKGGTVLGNVTIMMRRGADIQNASLIEAYVSQAAVALQKNRSERAMLQSEKKYRFLAENVLDVIWTSDLELNVTYISPSVERFLGFTVEEAHARPLSRMLTLEAQRRVERELARYYETKDKEDRHDSACIELEHVRKDGSTVWGEVSSNIAYDKSGNPIGIYGVTRDITERKKAEDLLRASLKEKEVMLKEIHHRVKNNMQIISSLLRLQSESLKNPEIREHFKTSQNRIKSMALIHESLYRSEDLSRIDFSMYLNSMSSHLLSMYGDVAGRVRISVDVQDVTLDISHAIPCGQIVNELLTNALKHAFPGNMQGEVFVRMRRNGKGRSIIEVKDNGVGLPPDLNLKKCKTLGMVLVNDLARQLGGDITILRSGGTAYTIDFPGQEC